MKIHSGHKTLLLRIATLIVFTITINHYAISQTTFVNNFNSYSERLRAAAVGKIGDGGIVILANGEAPQPISPNDGHYFLNKYDENGQLVWSKNYAQGVFAFTNDYNIFHCDDSTFYVLSNAALLRITNNGALLIKKLYVDSGYAYLRSGYPTNDSCILIIGRTIDDKIVLLKIRRDGQMVWSWDYDLIFRPDPRTILQESNGNLTLIGTFQDSLHGLQKTFFLRLSSTGQLISANEYLRSGTWGAASIAFDSINSVAYFLVYDTVNAQSILNKIDMNSGNIIWSKITGEKLASLIFKNDSIFALGRNGTTNLYCNLDTAGNATNLFTWSGESHLLGFIKDRNWVSSVTHSHIKICLNQFELSNGPLCPLQNFNIISTLTTSANNPINIQSNSRNFIDSTTSISLTNTNYTSSLSCVPTSIDQIPEDSEFYISQLYKDAIEIVYKGNRNLECQIEIYNMNGKLIRKGQKSFKSYDSCIINNSFSIGIYLIVIRSSTNSLLFRGKIAIQD